MSQDNVTERPSWGDPHSCMCIHVLMMPSFCSSARGIQGNTGFSARMMVTAMLFFTGALTGASPGNRFACFIEPKVWGLLELTSDSVCARLERPSSPLCSVAPEQVALGILDSPKPSAFEGSTRQAPAM